MKRSERLSAKDRRLLKETLKELNRQGRLQEEKLAKQHGSTSVYQHSINVAYLSLWLAGRLPLRTDRRALVRGALLHDYFLYDWHKKDDGQRWHGFRRGKTAARNAKRDYRLKDFVPSGRFACRKRLAAFQIMRSLSWACSNFSLFLPHPFFSVFSSS